MPANTAATGENVPVSDAVRLRLRALVRCLDDGPADEAAEQMLMDVDLDGQRYLLIRMPAVAQKSVSLSPREVEIVRLVAEGHQNKVIASVLDISSWTVCTHMRRVFAKFGVTSRAAMVARVAALGGIVDGMMVPPVPRPRAPEEDEDTAPYRSAAGRVASTAANRAAPARREPPACVAPPALALPRRAGVPPGLKSLPAHASTGAQRVR